VKLYFILYLYKEIKSKNIIYILCMYGVHQVSVNIICRCTTIPRDNIVTVECIFPFNQIVKMAFKLQSLIFRVFNLYIKKIK